MKHNPQQDEQHLSELFGSLKARLAPRTGHQEELRAALLAAMPADGHAVAFPRRAATRRYRLAALVAAMVLVALGVWVVLDSRSAVADFALVSQKIRDAKAVSYRWSIQLPGQPPAQLRVYMNNSGVVRTESDTKIKILDYPKRVFLVLNLQTKRANLVNEALPSDVGDTDVLARFRSLYAYNGQYAGRRELLGREMLVYEVPQEEGEKLVIVVDPRTYFPVRMEVTGGQKGRQIVEVLDDFQWNADLAASLFSTEVPEGFTLWDQVTPPTEQNLVAMLRTCVRIGNGSFPPDLEKLTIAGMVRSDIASRVGDSVAPSVGNLSVDTGQTDKQGKTDMAACVRGLRFITSLPEGSTWRYTGAGVRLGSAAPVFLWHIGGEENWHVIYGDLQAGQLRPEEVPKDATTEATENTERR